MLRPPLFLVPLLLAACAGPARESTSLECAPFARAATGIALYGDAADWWDASEGGYPHAAAPAPGAILVFRRTGRLPSGHVSVVRSVVSEREILVDQANWVHGQVTRAEPVIDVSGDNDWSAVRVWWAPAASLGASTYPTYGFIAP